ncbi:MAG: class I SAM-dependent methyltransferase [Candidatus Obscuribacterales bacterium]|nr:class I SAM-dependent methyltransferase [Steroidobacteraceae bacterium]
MSFADHFSTQATDYAKYRPGYPAALFDWLATLTPGHELAWDVGTGNGQAAVQVADYFAQVIATDPSADQIRSALAHPRVSYAVLPAEESYLSASSVDLVTVAQALHWFNFELFYAQVKRVLKPSGVLAAWTYGLHEISPELDVVLKRFYSEIVGPYWPPERHYIDDAYRSIPFPFAELQVPAMRLELMWTLHDLVGYLGTWSATQRYIKAQQSDPRELIFKELQDAWGSAQQQLVSWPLYFRIGALTPINAPQLA